MRIEEQRLLYLDYYISRQWYGCGIYRLDSELQRRPRKVVYYGHVERGILHVVTKLVETGTWLRAHVYELPIYCTSSSSS